MKKNPSLRYLVFILLAVIATYSNHFYNGFHFDDLHSVVDNTAIRSLKNLPSFFTDGTTSSVLPQNQAYRPVVTTSLAVDYWLGGGYNLFFFHLSTFILFLVQGLLMFLFFTKLLGVSASNKNISYVALFAVAWYLLHPAIAETVNYIIARSDVQSTVAVMAAFVLYIYSPFCRRYFIYLVPVAIGALAKPPSVMFAPLLFLYILFFEENTGLMDIFKKAHLKPLWNSFRKSLPSFIICAALYVLISRLTPKTWEPGGNSPGLYLITQPYVILHYFTTFFWPTGLSADSDWKVLPNIWHIQFFAGCLFILVMLVIAVYTSGKSLLRPIGFGILWFFITLAPTSSIIPLGEVLNDHRMYFPFIGLALSVSWSLGLLLQKLAGGEVHLVKYKNVLLIPVLLLLCTCAYGTYKRNTVWHSEESLWYNVTVKSPGNARGLMNYALIKIDDQKYAEAGKYFNRAMEMAPAYSFIYINMGVLKQRMGDNAAAENFYLHGIEMGDTYPSHFSLYGQFLYQQARFIEAEVMFQRAIALSGSFLEPRLYLMKTYEQLAEWDNLAALATNTLQISPGNPDAMAALNASRQKKTRAEVEADEVKRSPSAQKYLSLSLDYYQEGRYVQSLEAAMEAVRLKNDYAEAYNNIGCAYIAMNQFVKAVEPLQKALAIKPDYELAKNNLLLTQEHRNSPSQPVTAMRQTAEDYINQSLLYFNQRQYDLCIAACQGALALKPDYDLAYNNLCATYNKLGMWDDAIETGNQGLKVNPNNERLKNNLAEAMKGKQLGAKK